MRHIMLALTILLAASTLCATPAAAAIPHRMAWQGVALDSTGFPVSDGNYTFTFRIFDVPTGGSPLWSEVRVVTTENGVISLTLGTVVPIADSVFDDSLRYLEITFESDPPYAPRTSIVSVGFAYRVGSVDGAAGGTITSKVTIGPGNINTGAHAFVAGTNNRARGDYSVVSGGGGTAFAGLLDSNSASGDYSTVGGGARNFSRDFACTVNGGYQNAAAGTFSTVGGGTANFAVSLGGYSTVSGGFSNFASGNSATVGGGNTNAASGGESTVGGGIFDTASGGSATVPGGQYNKAAGAGSFAAGTKAKANHNGSFVWADFTPSVDFASTNPDQFLIRASGGVGIGTNSPAALLHVNGTAGNNTGVWSNLSDRRLKKDIEPIRNALETVEQLQPVSFRWKDSQKDAQFGRVRGLIAQDVEKAIPEWVKTDPDGYRRIEPIGVDALLIGAIKELHAKSLEVEHLKARLKELESENQTSIGELRTELAALESRLETLLAGGKAPWPERAGAAAPLSATEVGGVR